VRTAAGYRQYVSEDAARLRFIRRAQELGFSLEEIDTLLNLRADPDAPSLRVREQAAHKIDEIRSRIHDLQRIQATLEHLVDACDGHGPTSRCPILDALETPAP
jgi:DNA-binding transcriptional MerR regulator